MYMHGVGHICGLVHGVDSERISYCGGVNVMPVRSAFWTTLDCTFTSSLISLAFL